jgi:hypothetical protein
MTAINAGPIFDTFDPCGLSVGRADVSADCSALISKTDREAEL